ncbi:MAG: 50S ribosomal protein L9 [Actinobacteria bacterium]|nr:50S ribosomal protein L9 [Actinomycetota bacterium]
MRVVLRKDLKGLGRRGDIVTVADGYGRNHLLPQGLAFVASPGIAAQATAMRKARDLRELRDRDSAQAAAQQLVKATVKIQARASAAGRLFGSVTAADVAAAVHDQTGISLDRKKILMSEPIKSLGEVQVPLRLHEDVEVAVNVEVVQQA